MARGNYPFRCLSCSHRFWGSIWMFSIWQYAKCPKCLGLELSVWPRRSYHLSLGSKLRLTLGGHPYRCARCRCNFVSFRPLARFAQNGALGLENVTLENAALEENST
jgi:DNA-directed RNA polymerase subunit RPC12/RpoP